METVKWVRADCESTTCVEIARAEDVWAYRPQGASFAMRATELDATNLIWLTRDELVAFLSGVKAGQFDHLLGE